MHPYINFGPTAIRSIIKFGSTAMAEERVKVLTPKDQNRKERFKNLIDRCSKYFLLFSVKKNLLLQLNIGVKENTWIRTLV